VSVDRAARLVDGGANERSFSSATRSIGSANISIACNVLTARFYRAEQSIAKPESLHAELLMCNYNIDEDLKRCSHCARHRTTALDASTHDVGRYRTTQRHRTMSSDVVRCRTTSCGMWTATLNQCVQITATPDDIVRHSPMSCALRNVNTALGGVELIKTRLSKPMSRPKIQPSCARPN